MAGSYRTTLNVREKTESEEERERLLKECHQRCANRTLRTLEQNGGIFIKLGQHLSAMNYLLPPEWTTTFIPLQDRCPVSSIDSIRAMYREDTGGAELDDFFSTFDESPIGAASLAQVHLATVRETGQRVAVKVQHPALARFSPLDLALTRFTFSVLRRFFPEYDLSWLSSEMSLSLPQELDFRLEARNARRTASYFAQHCPELPLVVPDVLWARERILVMAFEPGARLDDVAYLDAHSIDRDDVSAALARIFNEMIFGSGAPLHCDPHGGNIAVRPADPSRRRSSARFRRWWQPWTWLRPRAPNFEVILYDHGLYRDIPTQLRRSYAKLWLAVLDGDVPAMRTHAKAVAGISDAQFPLFASAITGRDYSIIDPSSGPKPFASYPGSENRTGPPPYRSLLATTPRGVDPSERDANMGKTLVGEGLLPELVAMLGSVPRVVLLILKTNDLTRALDESLHTREGPARGFLILARCCARTVWEEQVELAMGGPPPTSPENKQKGTAAGDDQPDTYSWQAYVWPPSRARRLALAWLAYARVELRLELFEAWLGLRRLLGLRPLGVPADGGTGGERAPVAMRLA